MKLCCYRVGWRKLECRHIKSHHSLSGRMAPTPLRYPGASSDTPSPSSQCYLPGQGSPLCISQRPYCCWQQAQKLTVCVAALWIDTSWQKLEVTDRERWRPLFPPSCQRFSGCFCFWGFVLAFELPEQRFCKQRQQRRHKM